jgi:formylglycine-generating enzyme required for sulfatase activity
VGLFPNGNAACGAADMAGNVYEWCLTKWQALKTADEQKRYNDGKDADDERRDGSRVLRGGSWVLGGPARLRVANRLLSDPGHRNLRFGFRVVCVCGGSAPG